MTGKETALMPSTPLECLSQIPAHTRFAAESYPECWIMRTTLKVPHGTPLIDMYTA
ncbi:hypothetical protein LP420_01800 [Massilia sp. B-10]|nr:hypothetical protein LP420_01800 [Massilia sp. B-10]